MRTIIQDRPGKVPVEEMRSAFERAVTQTAAIQGTLPLQPLEQGGKFTGYEDEATDRLWIGFALAIRYKQESGRALINLPEHGASNLLGDILSDEVEPGPAFRPDGRQLFLMVLGGTRHMTAVVPGNQIVDCYLSLSGYLGDQIDARPIRDWLEDPRNWAHDAKLGPCRYSEELEAGVTLDFILLNDLAILGAIARDPICGDTLPECPLPHLLHPDEAGSEPIFIYGFLPASHSKLAYSVSDQQPQP